MQAFLKGRVLRWSPALMMMILIFIASATPGQDIPRFGWVDYYVKKGGHMTGYALLGIAYLHALSSNRAQNRRQLALAVFLSFLYAITDEIHQAFTPGRTALAADVLIDTVGAIIGVTFMTAAGKRSARSHKDQGHSI